MTSIGDIILVKIDVCRLTISIVKSVVWFLCDRELCHERVHVMSCQPRLILGRQASLKFLKDVICATLTQIFLRYFIILN